MLLVLYLLQYFIKQNYSISIQYWNKDHYYWNIFIYSCLKFSKRFSMLPRIYFESHWNIILTLCIRWNDERWKPDPRDNVMIIMIHQYRSCALCENWKTKQKHQSGNVWGRLYLLSILIIWKHISLYFIKLNKLFTI